MLCIPFSLIHHCDKWTARLYASVTWLKRSGFLFRCHNYSTGSSIIVRDFCFVLFYFSSALQTSAYSSLTNNWNPSRDPSSHSFLQTDTIHPSPLLSPGPPPPSLFFLSTCSPPPCNYKQRTQSDCISAPSDHGIEKPDMDRLNLWWEERVSSWLGPRPLKPQAVYDWLPLFLPLPFQSLPSRFLIRRAQDHGVYIPVWYDALYPLFFSYLAYEKLNLSPPTRYVIVK